MEAMSDTPLTDAQLVRVYGKTGTVCAATPSSGHPTYVPANFARAQEMQIYALSRVVQAFKELHDNAEEWECAALGLFAPHGWWEAVYEAMETLEPK